jgi:conjugative transfer region protein TrbK
MRALTLRGWGALGALLVFAAVVLATVSSTFGSRPPPQPVSVAQMVLANDVDRCSHAGEAAESDPSCQAAWRQFLGAHRAAGRP